MNKTQRRNQRHFIGLNDFRPGVKYAHLLHQKSDKTSKEYSVTERAESQAAKRRRRQMEKK